MSHTILITGASSGFGAMTARHLADAGHTVYASMRDIAGRNAQAAADTRAYAERNRADLRVVEMDVGNQQSVDAAVESILREHDALDVVVHNAGHMVLGPLEAFTPEEMAAVYDTNVLSTQRVNRAVLPHMRERRRGLLIWVGSSSTSGGTPPYLGPYFAAKAAEDSVAVSYAAELARFGIETSIIVPGAFTSGTHHFANAGHAGDEATAQAYEQLYAGLSETVAQKLAEQTPRDADPEEVARQIAHVVEMSHGTRPFRVHIDPLDDGATEVNAVRDRVRERFLRRVGIADLLVPADGDGR
jgi:NAD(P)-dependent dehydrogenase (short-subunit alcohol dehydrogenase family)